MSQFGLAVEESLLHPERNSSLILRAEVLFPDVQVEAPEAVKNISSYIPDSNLVRRLLPRQQNRDISLDQDCTFLLANCSPDPAPMAGSKQHDEYGHSPIDEERFSTLVVLTPRLAEGSSSLPWYHPPVRHLAFRFLVPNVPGDGSLIRIEIVLANPEHDSPSAADPTSRLYRTCLSLLETVYRYAKGKKNGYKKRVEHDVSSAKTGQVLCCLTRYHQTLVPRNEYQDLYMIMRDRFKDIADTWHEATDASKHVFEVGPAFLYFDCAK
jgi:tRNASer (uridine44-2'-O)-methyltransferase